MSFHQDRRGWARWVAVRQVAWSGNPAGCRAGRFNLEERFCCRFAADAATANRPRNCLLQLAAAQGAGPVYRPDGRLFYAFPGAEPESIRAVPHGRSPAA